jgi:uncharacterized protein (DUF983 family)
VIEPLNRTLDQELLALLRGASLECPVCGEFVLHDGPHVGCRECGMSAGPRIGFERAGLQLDAQAG